ncbi:hypothetical protein [Nocardia cyriacigeorgica]|jgi:hypothetical protein|uniref:Uncharacterized protein n=2 Tax=Nocardia cyriacigeorgica TaxID=135487 RepID=A0A2L2JTG9_9NOCA|nr:hypothetical protein [Nocardia cyriacigeorgica]AVH23134.1 hypothetical protein C5B73_18590 [Nocardia cyriacigeorgica]MBF6087923.1 hypothetical protein [Nocardia cyriacigeorgica]MBF6094157.1 hypothetical protein [Nocardia cyriacigeorgica]MBF6096920.1 hypothetical protein [Nocardia cyriacigeorgica]MBF6158395.1 hypothetical protein [Nocardia cyriacigeorgica]
MSSVRAMELLAYKQMPAEVVEPIMQLLNWLLWFVLIGCLAWMIVSAGKLWIAFRGDLAMNDSSHGVLMSLLGAGVASTASGIALAFLPA